MWGAHSKSHSPLGIQCGQSEIPELPCLHEWPIPCQTLSTFSLKKPLRIFSLSLSWYNFTVCSVGPLNLSRCRLSFLSPASVNHLIHFQPFRIFLKFLINGKLLSQTSAHDGLFLPFTFLSCPIKWGLGWGRELSPVVILGSIFTIRKKSALHACMHFCGLNRLR